MSTPGFKVGDRVLLERRGSTGFLDHVYEGTIDRETATRFYVGTMWFKKGTDTLIPRYLNYVTTVKPLEEKAQ